jgi:hypothetical protein
VFCADAIGGARSARAKTIGISLNDLFMSSVDWNVFRRWFVASSRLCCNPDVS